MAVGQQITAYCVTTGDRWMHSCVDSWVRRGYVKQKTIKYKFDFISPADDLFIIIITYIQSRTAVRSPLASENTYINIFALVDFFFFFCFLFDFSVLIFTYRTRSGQLISLYFVRGVRDMVEDIRYQRLPQSFSVRELGTTEARGLWGIKHTRKPVDLMVAKAKTSSTPLPPQVELRITEDGCEIVGNEYKKVFPIHTVSYGVQVSV